MMGQYRKADYGYGTYFEHEDPFGIIGGAALCSDGKVRRLKRVGHPDTFFSIPAAVRVFEFTVSGFVTLGEDVDGNEFVKFVALGKNSVFLPNWQNTKGE